MCVQTPYNEIRYSFPTNIDTRIPEYFDINPVTGLLTLKKSLMLDTQRSKSYGVSRLVFS